MLEQPRNFASDAEERSALIHREIFQLAALDRSSRSPRFCVTRAVAASNRDMSLRDAAEWFRRGQEAMQSGRVDDAIDSLRRATVRNRDDKRYVLALAQALALKHDTEAARSVLMTLRESEPEDRGDQPPAGPPRGRRGRTSPKRVRFYHNALYAPWPLEQADATARRATRADPVSARPRPDQSGALRTARA